MGILADNEVGISYDGTIDKLVVVGVGLDKVEVELRVETQYKRATENDTYNVCGKGGINFSGEYLHILTDNLVADA